jgi:hypothetical protein
MGAPSYPNPPPTPYAPPPNSITTATTGPQVKTGQPSQGGFQVLAVRPKLPTGGGVIRVPGPGVPPATRAIPADDKAGASPGSDATRGLLVRRRGPGGSLLR